MFIGRTSELNYLNTYYDRNDSQIMVVYGGKNVGKTGILRQFVNNKPCYYYLARSASEREQRYQWGKELGLTDSDSFQYPSFMEIFQTAVSQIEDHTQDKKVIIIDEFQHMIKQSGIFMKELVRFVRDLDPKMPVMMILCSSSTGWVENSMVTRIGNAAYEISGFLKIRELDFDTMMEYFPDFTMEQGVEVYAVLGGLPGFWKHFRDALSVKENICRYILNRESSLCGEGQRIVEAELRETGVYNTILASLASGHHKLNDLFLHTEFSRAKISVYLKNLMELELVEKVFSYDTDGKANTQKGIYRISNHFVHFYFTYLYPHLSQLEQMADSEFYDQYIAPAFKKYVAEYFKIVCRQKMEKWSREERLPFKIDKIGEWVGKAGSIDIVAQNENGKTIVGMCNWDKPVMAHSDYEQLLFCVEKAKLKIDYVYLFSVKHFDEKLNLEARVKQNLKLISMDVM